MRMSFKGTSHYPPLACTWQRIAFHSTMFFTADEQCFMFTNRFRSMSNINTLGLCPCFVDNRTQEHQKYCKTNKQLRFKSTFQLIILYPWHSSLAFHFYKKAELSDMVWTSLCMLFIYSDLYWPLNDQSASVLSLLESAIKNGRYSTANHKLCIETNKKQLQQLNDWKDAVHGVLPKPFCK